MKPFWIKWYPVQWLHSTARDEMDIEERATFQDFVCLAAISSMPGKFKFKNNESLARQLNTNVEIIEKTQKICLEKNRIKIKKDKEGFVCQIIKWYIYQSFKKEKDVNFKEEKKQEKLTINGLEKTRLDKTRLDKTKEEKKTIIPEWIPKKEFDEYKKMRIKIRKPMTDKAIQLAIRKLEELKKDGYDLKKVLEQSIFNSWQSLWPLKSDRTESRVGSFQQKRDPHPHEKELLNLLQEAEKKIREENLDKKGKELEILIRNTRGKISQDFWEKK